MRIAATAIIYDTDPEHPKLAALFDSTEKAGTTDYILGLDAKCHPNTERWIKKRLGDKAQTFQFVFADDFSAARNLTLERLTPEIDWFYWIDSDDTLEMQTGKTIPEVLETAPKDLPALWCEYNYEQDKYGNPMTSFVRVRFIRNNRMKWEWREPIHEDIHPERLLPGIVKCSDFVWLHHTGMVEDGRRDGTAERNFRILTKAIAEHPENPRNYYYLANQHFAQHHWREAIDHFETYIKTSGRLDEKWNSLVFQAIAHRELGDYQAAIACDTSAMHLMPLWADSYFGLGETYTRLGQWDHAKHWGELGLQRASSPDGIPPETLFLNSNNYLFRPYLWLAVAYYNLGNIDMAIESYAQAAKHRPEPDLLAKLETLKWSKNRSDAIEMGLMLSAALVRRNEPLKAKAVLESLPAGAADQNPSVNHALAVVNKKVAHLFDDTLYRNLYFEQEESMDPLAVLPNVKTGMPRLDWVLRRLQKMGAKKVLELGVGNAVSSFYYAQHGIQVIGLDVDARRVKDANWNAVKLGLMKSSYNEDFEQELPIMAPDAKARFYLGDASRVPESVRALGPFDAVVATEIIEHVLEPDKLLTEIESISPHVILSTPDGAFEGPQGDNPSHVRMWSQRELARDLIRRGRIVSLHKVAHPNPFDQSNLVAEYVARESAEGPLALIWCPNTGQDWTPDSIHQGGIGGSETAVIRVAEELVAKGYRVAVYAECEGVWNGVRYARSEQFYPKPCDLFVSWRTAGPIADMKDLAKHRWLWAHDVTLGPLSEADLDGTRIIALSEWHRRHLAEQYPTADIFVAGNGIDPERFAIKAHRDPYRLIYASSPDRGLDVVLRGFPKIRAMHPKATLDVYYGFDMARARNQRFIADIERMANQSGVTLHGRIDQESLAVEYRKASALLLPSTMPNGEPFTETYCISALEAQAAGCVPIARPVGALSETVVAGITHDDVMLGVADFFSMSTDTQESLRRKGRTWALTQTWSAVADAWIAECATDEVEASIPSLVGG